MDADCQGIGRFHQLIRRKILHQIQGYRAAKPGICESFGWHCEIFLSRTQKNTSHLLTSPETSAMPSHP
jgi:hypothetical protein